MHVRVMAGKTQIRLLLQKQSDLGLHCLSRPFCSQLVFEILEHLITVARIFQFCMEQA